MVEESSKQIPLHPDPDKSLDTQIADAAPDSPWRLSLRSHIWRPPTDVFATEDAIIVRVEIAGMREEDFSIELDGLNLSIRGLRQDLPERRAYHQMEIRFGEFVVELKLPFQVDAEQVEAVYSNGFLRILLPKAKTHQIPIAK